MKNLFLFLFLFLLSNFLYSEDCNSLINNFDSKVQLKSGWLFMKGDNPEWKSKDMEDTNWAKKTLPDSGRDPNPNVTETGFYWYRCRILLPESILDSANSISVDLGKLKDADEVYFNGSLIGSTGKFPPSQIADFERNRIYSISSKLLQPGLNLLAVRIYTSTDYFGIEYIPVLGSEIEINRENSLTEIFNITFGFVFIAMGLFFILGSIIRSTNKSNIFFSSFSIFLGFYILIRTQYRYRLFSDFSVSYRTELVLLMILPIMFINFVAYYVNHARRFYIWIFEILMGFMILFTIFFAKKPSMWELVIDIQAKFLLYSLILVLFIIYKGYLTHKKKLKYLFWGCVFLTPCIIIDILRALELIKFPSTSHFGFMVLLINISIQLSEEMVENYRKFQNQETDLKKMEKLKTNFLVNLSGEFKYYMDNMVYKARELLIDPENKQTIQRIKSMENYQALTRAVISDAVVLNAVENREYENIIEKFSIKDLVNDIVNTIESRLNQKRKNKTISITYGDFEIMQSKELFYLIFYHLIENVYKYTPSDSAYQVIVKSDLKNELEIHVIDEGVGVNIFEKSDILKKFVRGPNIPDEVPGVGIGIPLVKSISYFLGGQFDLQSVKGTGCKFVITLPI